jgi:hypothetical protein
MEISIAIYTLFACRRINVNDMLSKDFRTILFALHTKEEHLEVNLLLINFVKL